MPAGTRVGSGAALAAATVAGAALLVAAGQPIFTDDLWWHLAMGAAYAESGPWLAQDPMLHTAVSAPAPAAWLADLALHGVERSGGFPALRVLHVGLVAGILALAAAVLRRAGASAGETAAGLAVFVALAAYRLVQLRPHLATVAFTLLLVHLLLLRREPASLGRMAAAALLVGLWAQLHSGFVLGLLLIAAAVASCAAASLLRPAASAASDRRRALRFAGAGAAGLALSLLHPLGVEHHLAYLAAGVDTPALDVVADEWAPVRPFALPVPQLPPSLATWALLWGLGLATLAGAAASLRAWRRGRPGLDPVVLGLAAAGFVALLAAVRFAWLGLFGWAVAAGALRAAGASDGRRAWLAGSVAVAAAAGFLTIGAWPMVARSVRASLADYAQPYRAAKYHATTAWILADSGVRADLYNVYWLGNFLGYWLGPDSRAFVNGSLNVPASTLADALAIEERRGRNGESVESLLDRHGVDVFVGVGMPMASSRRLWTTAHLEHSPGWLLVFRNLSSSLWLRDDLANRANLERLRAHYEREGVPFDVERGFDAARVLRERRTWSIRNGLLPRHFARLVAESRAADPGRRRAAQGSLSTIYAVLGLYDAAIEIDRALLRADPVDAGARRRLAWCLLQSDRPEEALLELRDAADAPALAALAEHARRAAGTDDAAERARLRAATPLLSREEAARLGALVVRPPLRPARVRGGEARISPPPPPARAR